MSPPRIAVVLFGPPGQGSFNESGAAGAARARADGHAVEVHWFPPSDAAARSRRLADLCRTGPDLVVAHGGQGDAPVDAVAPDFPGVRFAITQGGHLGPNVACYEVLQEHSAFLAGVLAVAVSRTGRLGHFSGERVRPGLKGRAAFADGIRLAGAEAGIEVAASPLVTAFCGFQHDPDLAFRYVDAMADAGVDVLFAMIDGGRPGVSRACRARGIRQIGNVLDWVARDPEVFVASAVADSGSCVTQAIADFAAGRLAVGTHRQFGLESPERVRLVMRDDVGAELRGRIDGWSQRLLRGEVRPAEHYDGPEFDLPSDPAARD